MIFDEALYVDRARAPDSDPPSFIKIQAQKPYFVKNLCEALHVDRGRSPEAIKIVVLEIVGTYPTSCVSKFRVGLPKSYQNRSYVAPLVSSRKFRV